MARIASTTSSGVPVGPQMTLDALMQRQRQLAENLPSANREMTSPWQGAAYLGEVLANKVNQGRADSQLAEGRAGLAEAMAGVNWEGGPTGQQAAQVMQYDPDLGLKLYQSLADMAATRRAREQELADRGEARSYEERQLAGTREFEVGQESRINERERLEGIAEEERKAAASAAGQENWRPPTPEEVEAYGLKPDQPVRISTKSGKPEAIGGGPAVQVLPSEVGAKLGLADEFLTNYDSILASAARGEMTGPLDQPAAVTFGRGPGGEAYRQLRQGTEGLMRLMTGAGMPVSEAADRARQYEPLITDDAPTLVSKIEGLKAALESVRRGATAGRAFPDAPAATTPASAPSQYEPGKTYTFDEGTFIFKGGDSTKPESWQPASPGGP